MSQWSLSQLLSSLHEDIQQRLSVVRKTFGHPGTKGDASENVWIDMLDTYLPKRYQAAKAHVVDSLGNFSQQIDVVVFDRQYSPFIFTYENETIIPAESVYAVFEAKQTADAGPVAYAQEKVASVRRRDLPSEAVDSDSGWLAHLRERMESCIGPIHGQGAERKPHRGASGHRMRCRPRALFL